MNCQEFRHHWNKLHDSADLSHIDTLDLDARHSEAHIALCDNCLNWIEENLGSDEEVFMKEYPQPSAQMEDRIMKAIYESTAQSVVPPLSAAGQAGSMEQVSRRNTRRWQSFAWVGAAGFLLAVGVLSWRGMNSNDMGNMALNSAPATQKAASQPQASRNGEQTAAAPSVGIPDQQQTMREEATSPTESNKESTKQNTTGEANAGKTSSADAVDKNNAVALAPAAPLTTARVTPDAAKENAKASDAAQASAQERTSMAARDHKKTPAVAGPTPPAAQQAGSNAAVAMADAGKTEEKVAIGSEPGFGNMPAAQDQQVTAITALPADDQLADKHAITAGPPAPAGNAAAAKQPITVSTFTDVQTAMQASTLPIPSAPKLPNGFALHTVSLKYESETSKRVTEVTTVYSHNNGWIKIEVTPNEHGKRSLSIPGTFSQTQLFTIDNEQAIGVTYDHQAQTESTSEPPVQHAVFFNTTKQNQSLYVVITGNGAQLQELTELAKQLVWEK